MLSMTTSIKLHISRFDGGEELVIRNFGLVDGFGLATSTLVPFFGIVLL